MMKSGGMMKMEIPDTTDPGDLVGELERVLFRRVLANRIDGYTLETARELAKIANRSLQAQLASVNAECERWIKAYSIAFDQAMANGEEAANRSILAETFNGD